MQICACRRSVSGAPHIERELPINALQPRREGLMSADGIILGVHWQFLSRLLEEAAMEARGQGLGETSDATITVEPKFFAPACS